ncbi:HEPN domain-containing protein [Euhalothece natronophila Z-M001]|uniref:HEPN domain-containing protein n=1 Tax=Euhalothece natronophila Z-M001 TaxID=522448 RepID=A0A5B8NKF8_9CHRO|nr:HEPN domain-containing protein [Euhalothece natronophila]QDZ39813.1 HEPN domain-containing protein [Euhalothece natronophila Z-M001]
MTPEQNQLFQKAQQSLNAAQYLLAGGYYDFAVSRAYYTMFYIASAFLLGDGLTFSKHSGVISAFGREFAKTERVPVKFHRQLKEAQDLRNVGDYGATDLISREEAELQIQRAEAFLVFYSQNANAV